VDPLHPATDAIARAAAVVRSGGVVILPTSGLYGLGADALNPDAVERLFRFKGRDRSKPILVLIASEAMLHQVAGPVDALARSMMACFWPGRVTFVLPARQGLPQGLTGGTGKIGVRQVAHPVAGALVRALDSALTGTSANLSGATGCAVIDDIDPAVVDAVDLILDSGLLRGGPGSTVVDLTMEKPAILRAGAVPGDEIMAVFEQLQKAGRHASET